MSKKHRIGKYLHISARNCAILDYLDESNSEIVNQALEFYFKKKLKLSSDETDKACSLFMQRHYQLNLFDEQEQSGEDAHNKLFEE